MKILLEGAFGEANFGDDLLLLSTLQGIKQNFPGTCVLVCAREESFHGDYLDRIPGNPKIIRGWELMFCGYDLKLFAGGTQFYSYPSLTTNSEKKSYSLMNRMRDKLLRLRHKRKSIAFLGIGIGPFYQGNEIACERLLSKGAFLAVRDEASLGYLTQWGIEAEEVGADICFDRGWWLPSDYVAQRSCTSSPVGIVIRDFEYELPAKNYINPLLEFAVSLKDSGTSVRCFAFSKIKDRKSIERFQKEGFEVIVWEGEMSNLSRYLDSLSRCKMLISARYHGVVIGSVLGVPSIGVEVDPKVKLACNELGRGAKVWGAPFCKNDLQEKYDSLSIDLERAQVDLSINTGRLALRTQTMIKSFLEFTKREF